MLGYILYKFTENRKPNNEKECRRQNDIIELNLSKINEEVKEEVAVAAESGSADKEANSQQKEGKFSSKSTKIFSRGSIALGAMIIGIGILNVIRNRNK